MKVLIVTALGLEWKAVADHLTQVVERTGPDGTVYGMGRFGEGLGWDVCVVESGRGNARSASVTALGCTYFSPDIVLLVGVAGSLKSDVKLRDVVAATSVVNYEAGKDEGIFLPRPGYGLPAWVLEQRAIAVERNGRWQRRLLVDADEAELNAHTAQLVTGEKVVGSLDSATIKLIRQNHSQAYAVEMEGGGFHQAARELAIPALVIRGISDLCDEDKTALDAKGVQPQAAASAAAFAFELLATYEPPTSRPSVESPLPLPLPPAVQVALENIRQDDVGLADKLGSQLRTNEARGTLAESLVASPPNWLDQVGGRAWIAISYYAASYGAQVAASIAAERVARSSSPPDPGWLSRAAGFAALNDPERAGSLSAEAIRADPDDPLIKALHAALEGDNSAVAAVEPMRSLDAEETMMFGALRAAALDAMGDAVGAVAELENLADRFPDRSGIRIQLAQVLTSRAAKAESWDRSADLSRARDLALSARDLTRQWGGDSASAVVLACSIAIEQGDARAALGIGLPAPDGEATAAEAGNQAVLERVVGAALIAGQRDIARAVVPSLTEPHVRLLYQASLAKDSAAGTEEVIALLEEALAEASGESQRFGVLYQLAELGVEPLPDVEALPDELKDQVLSASDIAHQRFDSAQARLRQWRDKSVPGARALARSYQAAGQLDSALDTFRTAASRLQAPELLVDAVDLATNEGLDDQALALAREALLILPPSASAVGHVRRRLIELAGRTQQWREVEHQARAILRDERDASAAIRWALVVALFNQGGLADAWRVISDVDLQPLDQGQARIKVTLLTQFAPTAASVAEVLDLMERFADSEEFVAGSLMAIYQIKPEPTLPEDVLGRLHSSLGDFFERFPESEMVKRFSIEDPSAIAAYVKESLSEGADEMADLLSRVNRGEAPYGLLASVSGRPYALTVLARGAGYLVTQPEDPGVLELDRVTALEAPELPVIIDTSALAVSLQTGRWERVQGELHRLSMTNLATLDAAESMKQAAAKSTVSLGLDIATREPRLFEISQEQASTLAATARQAHEAAASLEQVVCTNLARFPDFDVERHGVWLGGIQVAADSSSVLFTDDWVMRALAREAGVKAFGTVGLIEAMLTRERITDSEALAWKRSLTEQLVGDMAPDLQNIVSMASSQNWGEGSAWWAATRPAFWRSPPVAFEIASDLMNQVAKSVPERLPDWLNALSRGAISRLPAPIGTQLVARLTVLAMNSGGLSPSQTPSLLEAVRHAIAQSGASDPLPEMAELLLSIGGPAMAKGDLARFILNLFSQASEADRAVVMQMILARG